MQNHNFENKWTIEKHSIEQQPWVIKKKKPSVVFVQTSDKIRKLNTFAYKAWIRRNISKYEYSVEKTEYQNGLYVPKQLPKLKRDEIVSERIQDAKDRYELIAPIVEDDEKRFLVTVIKVIYWWILYLC